MDVNIVTIPAMFGVAQQLWELQHYLHTSYLKLTVKKQRMEGPKQHMIRKCALPTKGMWVSTLSSKEAWPFTSGMNNYFREEQLTELNCI